MQEVRGLKTLSASFFIACALNYFAAFNMVGWNFLVPGQYTFGIACTLFLVVISLAALLWIAVSTPVDIVVAGGGLALALVLVSSLITTGAIELKDYFIWGFVVAVPVAVFAAAMLVHLRHSVGRIRVSRSLIRARPYGR
jgi:phosphatidylserine synthase